MNCDFPKGSVLEPLFHLFLLYVNDLKGTLSGLKCGGKTSPRSFSEKLKLSISLDQYSKDLSSLFSLYGKLRAIKIYQN